MRPDPTLPHPDHVPADGVYDFDLYHPPGVENGFHEAWLALHEEGVPDLIWTPHNGGHRLATRSRAAPKYFLITRVFPAASI